MLFQEHPPHVYEFDGSPYGDQVLKNIELPKDDQSNRLPGAMDHHYIEASVINTHTPFALSFFTKRTSAPHEELL